MRGVNLSSTKLPSDEDEYLDDMPEEGCEDHYEDNYEESYEAGGQASMTRTRMLLP